MVVGRLLTFWEGNFSGAMLNFGRVTCPFWGFFQLAGVQVQFFFVAGGAEDESFDRQRCKHVFSTHKIMVQWNKYENMEKAFQFIIISICIHIRLLYAKVRVLNFWSSSHPATVKQDASCYRGPCNMYVKILLNFCSIGIGGYNPKIHPGKLTWNTINAGLIQIIFPRVSGKNNG